MKIRAVQLDLARQPETLAYIRDFIAFAADFGFNALVLYLEGRIKTASFPYLPDNQSYAPNDVAKIVKWAEQKNMDVIPVVSNLAHAEHFLRCPQLAHLAELREGRPGRFAGAEHVCCPSLEETHRFFEAYFREVAALFPSPYFHAGNDEAWDIGFCSLCKKRLQHGETGADIFAAHLRKTHAIIAGQLGKRMMIWDDLFEFYPEALARIPRDIIMCHWHYDSLVDKPQTHFGNRRRINSLAVYKKLGFEFLICPWDWHPRNVSSLTAYAEPYRPLGALLTTWEKSNKFLLENFPTVAFAGRWWQQQRRLEPEDAYREVCRKIFAVQDKIFLDALLAVKHLGRWRGIFQLQDVLCGPVSPYEDERSKQAFLLEQILRPWMRRISSGRGRLILADILAHLSEENISHRLRALIDALSARPNTARLLKEAQRQCSRIIREILKYKKIRRKEWRTIRPGLTPVGTDKACAAFENAAQCLRTRLVKCRGLGTRLNIRYFLPDQYGVQNVRLSLRCKSGGWKKIYDGVPKSNLADFSQMPYYIMTCLLDDQKQPPEKVRLETWGYGGIGVAFLEVQTAAGRYVPAKIVRTMGMVRDAQNILVDDTRWTFLGEPDGMKAYFNPVLAGHRHILEVKLAPAFD